MPDSGQAGMWSPKAGIIRLADKGANRKCLGTELTSVRMACSWSQEPSLLKMLERKKRHTFPAESRPGGRDRSTWTWAGENALNPSCTTMRPVRMQLWGSMAFRWAVRIRPSLHWWTVVGPQCFSPVCEINGWAGREGPGHEARAMWSPLASSRPHYSGATQEHRGGP